MTFIKQSLSPWSNLSQHFFVVVVLFCCFVVFCFCFFLFIDQSPILGSVYSYFCESVTKFILALKDLDSVSYPYPVEKSSDF